MNNQKLPIFFQYLLPKIDDVLFISVLIMGFLLGPRMLSIDSDIGRHLTIGNYILETKQIPAEDILSHTKSGESRPPYEWLSQVLFAIAYKWINLDGVILFSSLVIAFTFYLIYKESVSQNHSSIISVFITILGIAASSIHWLPRPHIITFFMLFVWVKQLEKFKRNEHQKVWIFPVLMILWANLHGGFIFGFLAWVAYFAGEVWDKFTKNGQVKIKEFLLVGIFSAIGSIITPDSWGNWQAVLGNNSLYILQNTVETMSPNFYQSGMLPFLLLLGLTLTIPLLANTQLHTGQVFLLSGMLMASLLAQRNIPLFVVIAIPILNECVQPSKFSKFLEIVENRIYSLQSQLKSYWSLFASIALSFFLFSNYTTRQTSLIQFDQNVFPIQAVQWLEQNPQEGNLFNEFNWGGYLEYKLFPTHKVFLDSQTDFYGENLIREYSQIISAQSNWEEMLKKHQVELVIIHSNSPLAIVLSTDVDWVLVYQDDIAVIYNKLK